MSARIEMGLGADGAPAEVDLEELLATRLLVQGNSGSGKSHLLRRLLEESAGLVQQVVIDPEGDFVSLGDVFGHTAIEASEYSTAEIARMAARVREHRVSVVLSLEGLEIDAQMRCAAAFLSALFEAPRDHWYPALVVVDEAQLFAPAAAGEVSDESRRLSLAAMTNLMCRGRKRGLAGVIATQRLAKLAKNVAAEASNFLMGRTFLDIDMARAADLLGMERRQAEAIRDLARGQFLALGPALSRRPVNIRIGAVRTQARSSSPKLIPLPTAETIGLDDLLEPVAAELLPLPVSIPTPPTADEVLRTLESVEAPPPSNLPRIDMDEEKARGIVESALAGVAAEPGAAFRPIAALYQDFQLRCRMLGLATPPLDLAAFRTRLAMTRAGIDGDESWQGVLALGATLPEDMLPVFLLLAKAARDEVECPPETALAEAYGTSSTSRLKRVLAFMEERQIIVVRVDLGGRRAITLPHFGWSTRPGEATEDVPERRHRQVR